jgi:galactose mutarotase-like enzyme
VFAPAGGEFVCFEPMTAPGNALNSGSGLTVLAPGGEFHAAFRVRLSGEPAGS